MTGMACDGCASPREEDATLLRPEVDQDPEAQWVAARRLRGRRVTMGRALSLTAAVAVVGGLAWLCVSSWSGGGGVSTAAGQPSGKPQNLVAESVADSKEVCNPEVPNPSNVVPRAFNFTPDVQRMCLPTHVPWPRWKGRNLCWGWVKMMAAREHGHIPWDEALRRVRHTGHFNFLESAVIEPLTNPSLCDKQENGVAAEATDEERGLAKAWLEKNVDMFVMNLDVDKERLARFNASMMNVSLPFRRIPGMDLRVPGELERAAAQNLIPQSYNITLAKEAAKHDSEAMGSITGTIGIAIAHLNGLKVAKANSSKPLAIIFEDDVTPTADFALKLKRLVEDEAPCDWQAISLKSRFSYGRCVSKHLSRVEPDGNEPASRCRHGVNYGFYAMLYRTSTLDEVREKLAAQVWNVTNPHCLDIDVALAASSESINYYAVPGVQIPGLIHEGGMGSSRVRNNWFTVGEGVKQD